jgi:hypothetical protein
MSARTTAGNDPLETFTSQRCVLNTRSNPRAKSAKRLICHDPHAKIVPFQRRHRLERESVMVVRTNQMGL